MLDQSINIDSLKFVISNYEREVLFKKEFQYEEEVDLLKNLIDYFHNEDFKSPRRNKLKRKNVFQQINFNEYLLTKRFITSFKVINNLKQSNRNQIIDAIVALLEEGKPYNIYRLDIKDFYETVNQEELFNKISEDSGYSLSTIKVLEKLFKSYSLIPMKNNETPKGLLRGLNLSSVLSEYYIRDFDKECKRLKGIYFYARFVDDIIIFTTDNIFDIVKLESLLPKGLEFHKQGEKFGTYEISLAHRIFKNDTSPIKFSYLGYEFTILFDVNEKGKIIGLSHTIDLSSNKIRKFKTRIVKSFLDYRKNNDFELLKDRIKMLTHNYFIYSQNRDTKVKTGIYYNYKHITKDKIKSEDLSLNKLDRFLRMIIYDNRASSDILGFSHNLNVNQKRQLAKLSFRKGFEDRKFQKFSINRFKNIKSCWSW